MAKETAHHAHATAIIGKTHVAFRRRKKRRKGKLSKHKPLNSKLLNRNTNCHKAKKIRSKMFLPKKEKS